ncbi:MAG: hypothetical protein EB084_12820 [Proteobacteria bacterium]|nr:hypothetical protein [Pseudomonadota bacterium]
MGRLLVNLVIVSLLVLIFNALGLVTLSATPHMAKDPTLGHVLDATVIGVVICAAGEVGSLLFALFVVVTFGLGCILLPVYWLLIGYFKLKLASTVLPGWFDYSHNLLSVLFVSWTLGASRLQTQRERTFGRRRQPDETPPGQPREVVAEWHEINDPPPR